MKALYILEVLILIALSVGWFLLSFEYKTFLARAASRVGTVMLIGLAMMVMVIARNQ